MSAATPGAPAGDGLPDGVPDLGDVAGDWVDAADLAHLPSLRNQCGQAHVNGDLTSLSWLAAPPYSWGYHSGRLRVDGAVPDAQRYRWKPWGVQREHTSGGVRLRTDTRMVLGRDLVLWQVEVTNGGPHPVELSVSQDLFAMLAHTETGWGWLYDVPWTAGNYHDFMTLERIRAGAPYLLGHGTRRLRLGRPRLPGIQRDAGTEAMSLEYELPRHVSQDTVYPHRSSATATVRGLRYRDIDLVPDEVVLEPSSEVAAGDIELSAGSALRFELRLDAADQTGIVLTHGNHPDSLQVGVDAGRLWFGIAGTRESVERDIAVGRWYTVAVALGDERVALLLDDEQVAVTGDWTDSPRWKALCDRTGVSIADSLSPARAAYAFDTPPDAVEELGAGARATWNLAIEPGDSRRFGVVCAYGTDAVDVAAEAARAAAGFPAALARTEHGYRALWRAMFTPGNGEFSGHLPALRAADPGIARSYYMGALLALYLRNTRISDAGPIFLTGGPRLGPTTTYFWDHAEWSRLYALLDPAGLRSWLLRALSGPYGASFGFDTRNGGPLGNAYAATDYALFRLAEHYVCVTGDVSFLDEPAGGRTVLEHLGSLAHGWRGRGDGIPADFGADPWRLLECVPNYVNVVASFNAAYAGMLRSYAGLLRRLGRDREANTADGDATAMSAAVLDLYVPGGLWRITHPWGTEPIGHCLDFGLVAAHLHTDLDERQRGEMVAFVTDKLLASTWMRALTPDDPAAPLSNRPDHGAAGAFCAWPGVTAYGLAKLGRADLAAGLLSRVHASASGGLWGQAMEIIAGPNGESVRVAEDGVSNRDSIGGVGIAEAVVSGLFGFEPSFAGPPMELPDSIEVTDFGRLSNLNVGRWRG
ncbi:hypothetical protein [Rugosimonospora africana]|uniref:Uncharacterized protein n=1 Tax=Rugosimonospora africana TaxID=556532 RepID=A0A8J3QU17_9ACTN|nr:hypothetical protein [Rugosimonospora africana]GIH15698.1 hypothetical protein Raf01_38700 [Rugosimonospora africana]